jgi:hypothetical protein
MLGQHAELVEPGAVESRQAHEDQRQPAAERDDPPMVAKIKAT